MIVAVTVVGSRLITISILFTNCIFTTMYNPVRYERKAGFLFYQNPNITNLLVIHYVMNASMYVLKGKIPSNMFGLHLFGIFSPTQWFQNFIEQGCYAKFMVMNYGKLFQHP